jgi:hypothetical protein
LLSLPENITKKTIYIFELYHKTAAAWALALGHGAMKVLDACDDILRNSYIVWIQSWDGEGGALTKQNNCMIVKLSE